MFTVTDLIHWTKLRLFPWLQMHLFFPLVWDHFNWTNSKLLIKESFGIYANRHLEINENSHTIKIIDLKENLGSKFQFNF